MLSLLIKYPRSWDTVLSQAPSLDEFEQKLNKLHFMVVEISLVQHRGVVDFIHFRLKGDPERRIPSWLDKPANELLTPEVLFDHFLDRIRERSETQLYVQRVFETSQDEIPDQRNIALVVIKLLILFAISPVKYKYTVRHMAEMVLFQITPMEAEINYQFLHDILDRLAKEGSYVRVETRDDPLDNHYYIDLKADIGGIMRRRIRHMASEFFPEDRRLFWKTAAIVDSPYLPLDGWVDAGRQRVTLSWQHTQRVGTLLLRQLDELSINELEGLSRQWARSEEDFFLLVGTTHNRDEQYRHTKNDLLPKIREHQPGTFLFWIPGAFEGEIKWLKEILAALLLREGMNRQSKDKAQQGADFLHAFVDREKSRLIEYFSKRYYHGTLLWDENRVDLSRFGYLSQEKFLAEFVHPLLQRRFPKHSRIQPYMDALGKGEIIGEEVRQAMSKHPLIPRKFRDMPVTLAQTRKIIEDWLTEETISGDTFLHFLGKGDTGTSDRTKEAFRVFLPTSLPA